LQSWLPGGLQAINIAAIQALAKGLLKTNKALIVTSGTGVVEADNGKETFEDSLVSKEMRFKVRAEESAWIKPTKRRGLLENLESGTICGARLR